MSTLDQVKRYAQRIYDFRSGELIDMSGNSAVSPTGTAVSFITAEKGRGVYFKSVTSKLDYGATDPIGTGNVTVVVMAKPDSLGGGGVGRFFNNGKTVATLYNGNKLNFSSDNSTIAASTNNSVTLGATQVYAFTRTSTGIVNFFVNGVQNGTRNQTSGTPVGGNVNFTIGVATFSWDGTIYYLAIYNQILTEQQISQISDELMNEKTITLPAVKTVSDVNLLMDGNMEWADTSWFGTTGSAVLSKQTVNPYKGKQSLRVTLAGASGSATQAALVAGKYYRLTGKCRSDGSATPRIYMGSGLNAFTGTTSTSWQNIDIIAMRTGSDYVLLYAGGAAGQYVEFDDLKVVEVPALASYQAVNYPAYFDLNGRGWNRSFSNEV